MSDADCDWVPRAARTGVLSEQRFLTPLFPRVVGKQRNSLNKLAILTTQPRLQTTFNNVGIRSVRLCCILLISHAAARLVCRDCPTESRFA